MDKSKIKIYNDKEAGKKISEFSNDWTEILDGSSIHQTGLKLFVQENKSGNLEIVSENFEDWANHMVRDEGLSGREVYMYRTRLSQEFEALFLQYMKRMEVCSEIMPYMMEQTLNNKHKS